MIEVDLGGGRSAELQLYRSSLLDDVVSSFVEKHQLSLGIPMFFTGALLCVFIALMRISSYV